MVTLEEVDKLKVNELKAACKELGLEQSGNKADLVARLKTALAHESGGAGGEAAPVAALADGSEPIAEEGKAEENGGAEEGGAAGAGATASNPEAAEATPAPEDGAPEATGASKRAKILFSDAEAAKFEATKVQVVNTAPADKPKQLTEAEKVRLRKDRFKDPDTERKKQRAQRFNLIDADLEKDKMLKRAERFGTSHPELDKIKLEQRAARFGIVDEETKKKQRLDKFKPLPSGEKANFGVAVKQDADFEEKRKARAARFAAAT
ncbi:hypothetical protein GPECTOR_1g471 [Gonium pectorale]|uniref:SAP domain-containing protein n=1 Tax=Gonium pectorale TaxID=33097 RepID=A0A150H3B3_GONPE|nr:hypothetical protein GPECTOR_1g471 [Gonium pectorale]|eukprot:KXZ56525.1 hypothetical protein GPECTOR_1g471 [Gonium pectorale]